MSKVYCGQCEYFNSGYSDRYYEHCAAPGNLWEETVETHIGVRLEKKAKTPADKNKNRDCEDFKEIKMPTRGA